MSYTKDFNAFVGGTRGFFKGLKIDQKNCIVKNIQSLTAITRDHEITAMTWGDNAEKDILIACGSKENRSVKIFDTEYSAFTSSFNCDIGEGKIKGISRYNDTVITAVESGHVKLWRYDKDEQILINAGKDLHRMRHSKFDEKIIATGGRENELKLFDLETQKQVFTEKNVAPDALQLRKPIWVSDIGFLPNSLVATASKFGYIRLYDPGAQRRPVLNLLLKNEALTALTTTSKEKHVVVASGRGRMNLIDFRNPGKVLNTYRGAVGGITDLSCSQSEPLLVSVSLDRHLRIHHMETKRLLEKIYLISSLNSLLLRSNFSIREDKKTEADGEGVNACIPKTNELSSTNHSIDTSTAPGDPDSDTEYDEMFGEMPVIENDANDADLTKNKRPYPYKKAIVQDSNLEKHVATEGEKKSVAIQRDGKKPKFH
ncbi:WD repeat-containing protein 74 [Athalia rosae]|uniref:WD repeat-containing protein 74 n=1 Tax=Athalia rosae TaxID=37344 RepID=UPI00203362A9|nr:WD repeat-containing protein 74 [Athalia rosae]